MRHGFAVNLAVHAGGNKWELGHLTSRVGIIQSWPWLGALRGEVAKEELGFRRDRLRYLLDFDDDRRACTVSCRAAQTGVRLERVARHQVVEVFVVQSKASSS